MRDPTSLPLTRDAVAAALSTMAFRTIDPDLSLNLHYAIFGDEAESLLERIRALYGVDADLFWSRVEFGRHFEAETNWAPFPVWVLWFLVWCVVSPFWRPKPHEDVRSSFTVDLLVGILEACRAEAEAPPSHPAPNR